MITAQAIAEIVMVVGALLETLRPIFTITVTFVTTVRELLIALGL